MRAQALSYYDRLYALLGDTQSREEYLSTYRIRVGEDGHFLHIKDGDCYEKRVDSTHRLQEDGNFLEIPRSSKAS